MTALTVDRDDDDDDVEENKKISELGKNIHNLPNNNNNTLHRIPAYTLEWINLDFREKDKKKKHYFDNYTDLPLKCNSNCKM